MGKASPGRVALISIHPRHAEAILDGRKLVELRRAPFAPDTTHALIYATAPVSAVVGWFAVASIEGDNMTSLWDRFGRVAAISRREHRSYFAGAKRAYAIRISAVHRYGTPIPLTRFPDVRRPPQSFQYLHPRDVSWAFARGGAAPSTDNHEDRASSTTTAAQRDRRLGVAGTTSRF